MLREIRNSIYHAMQFMVQIVVSNNSNSIWVQVKGYHRVLSVKAKKRMLIHDDR